MKHAALAGILIICILLSGCSILSHRDYVWMDTHPIPTAPAGNQSISAADYESLCAVLTQLVEAGTAQANIAVGQYNQDLVEQDMQQAVQDIRATSPIAAYAVENIAYTLGTVGGERVLAVTISYLHGQTEIKKIKQVKDLPAAYEDIYDALVACETGLVLLVEAYTQKDLVQVVEDYALQCPEKVMEIPQVTVNLYPEEGVSRVVEIKFTYQTSRDTLKTMQTQVENLFKSAQFFTSGYGTDLRKFTRLYTWLMETNEYTIQTSITPAYSLLRYGTGDSRAFATVYTALCRRMELECISVSGTKNGESYYWNLIRIDDVYYHLDLLQCSADGGFATRTDGQMTDYVWDYDAYPVSPDPEPEPTVPETVVATAPQE